VSTASIEPRGVTRYEPLEGGRRFLSDIIIELGLAEEDHVNRAVEDARTSRASVGQILVQKGHLSENDLARAMAARYGLCYIDLSEFEVDPSAANLLPPALAQRYSAVPVAFTTDGGLLVALADPGDSLALSDIAHTTHLEVQPAIAALAPITELAERLPLPLDGSNVSQFPVPAAAAALAPEPGGGLQAVPSPAETTPPATTVDTAELEQARGELDEANAALETARAEVQRLAAELDEKGAELAGKSAELEEKSAELMERRAELEDKSAELEQKSAQLEETSAELEQKRQADQVADEEQQEAFDALASIRTELESTRSELDETGAELENLRSEEKAMRSELEDLASERDSLANERESLASERDNIQSTLSATQAERDAIQADRDAIRSELDESRSARDTANAKLEAAAEERDAVRSELEGSQAQVQEASAALRSSQEEAARVSAELETARTEAESARTELEPIRAQLKASQEESDRRDEELGATRAELESSAEELKRALEEAEQARAEAVSDRAAAERVAELEGLLADLEEGSERRLADARELVVKMRNDFELEREGYAMTERDLKGRLASETEQHQAMLDAHVALSERVSGLETENAALSDANQQAKRWSTELAHDVQELVSALEKPAADEDTGSQKPAVDRRFEEGADEAELPATDDVSAEAA
jgi:chromosome segregation ATPase